MLNYVIIKYILLYSLLPNYVLVQETLQLIRLLCYLFQKHEPPLYVEGEDMKYIDSGFDFYSITSWLDNIVDKIDLRDTASVLTAERYLNGFYCLSSDYMPSTRER